MEMRHAELVSASHREINLHKKEVRSWIKVQIDDKNLMSLKIH